MYRPLEISRYATVTGGGCRFRAFPGAYKRFDPANRVGAAPHSSPAQNISCMHLASPRNRDTPRLWPISRGASAASGRPTSHAGGPADPVGTRPVVRWARGDPRSPLRPGGMRCDAATRAAGPPTDECAECCHQHLSRSRRRRTSAWADQSSRLHHPRAAWQDVCIQCRRMHSRRLAAAAAAGAPTGGGAASRRAACRA